MHGIDPATPARIASTFNSGALRARHCRGRGESRLGQPLTVSAHHKSLPSGVLQYEPDGTLVPVQETAAKMISISDNTAADMLINLVGRPAVEAALTTTGMTNPALDRPFLTTREMSILTLDPALQRRYLAANDAGRRALLANTVDRLSLPEVRSAIATLTSRGPAGLAYFASADDICRAYASLAALTRRPRPIPDRPGALDQRRRPRSRPGTVEDDLVQGRIRGFGPRLGLSGHHPDRAQLRRHRARREPVQPIDRTAGPIILSAIKGALALASGR